MNSTAYPGTQSVSRALGILKQFHASPELTLRAIRERSGLNRSTVFRLLSALEAEGMVERAGEHYRLGPQIAALGRRASGTGDLRELARRTLEGLARELGETVTIETLAGDRVLIVGEAVTSHVLGAQPSVGTSWPAHATSSGKVLLAALDPAESEAALRGRLHPVTERTITTKKAFADELERVARRGWASAYEELELGYVAVAVPVVDAAGATIAALSAGGPKNRLPRQALGGVAERLREGARAVARELGAG